MRRFFDPKRWRVILFDQRGSGRSSPHSSLAHNTTWTLVDDMEQLRRHLGVSRWCLFGGSWGSTLALAYAAHHLDRVTGLILRGVFLMTPAELDWFYGGGAGAILPEAWDRFLGALSPNERSAPIPAYYARLTGDDARTRAAAALAWTAWESAALDPWRGAAGPRLRQSADPAATDALARIECHFFHHNGFLNHPNEIADVSHTLTDVPGRIVQGRLDLVTPPRAAYTLARDWGAACRLTMVEGAGHAASDPGIIDGLVRATDAFADLAV